MCTDHSHRIWTLFWSHYSSLKILYVCVILKQGPASWIRYNSVLAIGCSTHSDEFLSNFYINKLILQNYRKISSIFSLKKKTHEILSVYELFKVSQKRILQEESEKSQTDTYYFWFSYFKKTPGCAWLAFPIM